MRVHTCSENTNRGFAFNEGWAHFWSGECPGTYGDDPTDYCIEGNVATALRNLKNSCGMSDSRMVDILWNNKGKIHCFDEFERLSGC